MHAKVINAYINQKISVGVLLSKAYDNLFIMPLPDILVTNLGFIQIEVDTVRVYKVEINLIVDYQRPYMG